MNCPHTILNHDDFKSYGNQVVRSLRENLPKGARLYCQGQVIVVTTKCGRQTFIWVDKPYERDYAARILAAHRLYENHPDVFCFEGRPGYDIYLDLVPGDKTKRAPCKPCGQAHGYGYGDAKFPYSEYRAMKHRCGPSRDKRPIVYGKVRLHHKLYQAEVKRMIGIIIDRSKGEQK